MVVNLLCKYLRFKDLPSSVIPHLTKSPRRLQIRKKVKENKLYFGLMVTISNAARIAWPILTLFCVSI